MIPTNLPHEAHFATGPGTTTPLPVLAWDANGDPLVADEHGLRPAKEWSNYSFVRPTTPAPVVAAVPGGGYLAHYQQDDGKTFASPIVAWLVRADGTVTPVATDGDGLCGDPTETANFLAINHPGHPAPDDAD